MIKQVISKNLSWSKEYILPIYLFYLGFCSLDICVYLQGTLNLIRLSIRFGWALWLGQTKKM